MPSKPAGTLEHVDDEAFIIVKAAPRASQTYGETVCIAAVDRNGDWCRLYPVSFRYLDEAKRFGRWNRIKYRWRRPRTLADARTESRRVDADSIEIVGSLPKSERPSLVNRIAVSSLARERERNRSLAMLDCEIEGFWAVRRTPEELEKQRKTYANLLAQQDMFAVVETVVPREPCPFSFMYRYRDNDGSHEGTCQDWETEATFMHRLRDQVSEQRALEWVIAKFGEELPRLGMFLAMGTHRRWPDQWLINGVIRCDHQTVPTLL